MSRRKSRRGGRGAPLRESEADITDLAEDGRGVARIDGKVTFVTGALPGEHVQLQVMRSRRDVDEGVATVIQQASPQRVEPGCEHFDICGGCALQHLAPEAQIAFKQKQVLDALAHIGHVQPEAVAEPVAGPTWGYRRRARLGARWVYNKNRALVGFRERSGGKIAVLSRCEVLDERVGSRLEALGELIGTLSIREKIPQLEVATADDAVVL
ncbi:MAG: 23S rRNA (uracil(1939)-C(5))-methyltransferase, partial [Sinobacteraceae bacterium]|nr:23S rRNA (uracil(1939)-C(5))-methyltransferase [Nevskiaceae bacterium]